MSIPPALDLTRLLVGTVTLTLAATLLTGCPVNLITRPITRQDDHWRATLTALHDGPNVIRPTGWTAYFAGAGRRLLHATFEVTNLAPGPRAFDYGACVMDIDALGVAPGLVTSRNGIWMAMPSIESYGVGEESTRMLTYSYPEFRFPSRIECPGMRFDIPPPGSAAPSPGTNPPPPPPPPPTATVAPWAIAPPGGNGG